MTPSPIVLMTVGSNHQASVNRLKMLGATVVVATTYKGAPALYRMATHVFLPGGTDVHPAQYGRALTHARPNDSERDELELALADAAILDGKPLFGVCRGHQVITVAAGGTLFQDLWRDKKVPHFSTRHPIEMVPGSLLHSLTRLRKTVQPGLWVNSYHHQAVAKVPRGWKVVAKADDGVVEAIEYPGLPIVSVQWHPEILETVAAVNMFRGWLALRGQKGARQ